MRLPGRSSSTTKPTRSRSGWSTRLVADVDPSQATTARLAHDAGDEGGSDAAAAVVRVDVEHVHLAGVGEVREAHELLRTDGNDRPGNGPPAPQRSRLMSRPAPTPPPALACSAQEPSDGRPHGRPRACQLRRRPRTPARSSSGLCHAAQRTSSGRRLLAASRTPCRRYPKQSPAFQSSGNGPTTWTRRSPATSRGVPLTIS